MVLIINILTRCKSILAYILCKHQKKKKKERKKKNLSLHTPHCYSTVHPSSSLFLSPNQIEIQWLAQDLPRVHTHLLIASLPSFQLAI